MLTDLDIPEPQVPNHGTWWELFGEDFQGVADDLVGVVKQVIKAILREDAALEALG